MRQLVVALVLSGLVLVGWGCADMRGRVDARLNTKIAGWEQANPGKPVTNDVFLKLRAEAEAEIAAEVAAANQAAAAQALKAGDAALTGGYVTAAILALGALGMWLAGGKKPEPELPPKVPSTTPGPLPADASMAKL